MIDVSLLTGGRNNAAETGSVASVTSWKAPLMRHADTYWNKFVGIACAPRPLLAQRAAWLRVAVTITITHSEDAG
jgi:hypothetical protein